MPEFVVRAYAEYTITADNLVEAGKVAEENFMALAEFDVSRNILWSDCDSKVADAEEVENDGYDLYWRENLRSGVWQSTSELAEKELD